MVRALHRELRERLLADIQRQEGKDLPHDDKTPTIDELTRGRESLFADGFGAHRYLAPNSVVQMAINLPAGEELQSGARVVCLRRTDPEAVPLQLGPAVRGRVSRLRGLSLDPAGEDVESGLAHFRTKAETADPETVGTYPAQVYVNLLLKLGRNDEALAAAKRFLSGQDPRHLSCPGADGVMSRAHDYPGLAGRRVPPATRSIFWRD